MINIDNQIFNLDKRPKTTLNANNESSDADFKISSFDLMNYDQIYLATKSNYYQFNSLTISKLTSDLLFRNALLNHEIELLYPNREHLIGTKSFLTKIYISS